MPSFTARALPPYGMSGSFHTCVMRNTKRVGNWILPPCVPISMYNVGWGGASSWPSLFRNSPLILLFLTSRKSKKVRVMIPKPYRFVCFQNGYLYGGSKSQNAWIILYRAEAQEPGLVKKTLKITSLAKCFLVSIFVTSNGFILCTVPNTWLQIYQFM